MPSHRTGLLVIRAWVEEGSAEPLRAHVRVTGDISTGAARTVTISEPAAVVELVETWLQTIRSASDEQLSP
jgi:hypothetical protein